MTIRRLGSRLLTFLTLLALALATPLVHAQGGEGGSEGIAQQSVATQDEGDSRAEQLLAERRRRLAEVEPAKYPSWIHLLATAENKGFSEIVTWQVDNWRVGFGKLSPVSGFAPALSYQMPRVGDTLLTWKASAGVSVTGYQAYEMQFGVFENTMPNDYEGDGFLGAPFIWDNRTQDIPDKLLYLNLNWSSFPREEFYGLGNDSQEANRSDYLYQQGGVGVAGGWQFTRWLGFLARGGYVGTNVGPGSNDNLQNTEDLFDESSAPGIEDQPDFTHFDAGLYAGWGGEPMRPIGIVGVRFDRWDQLDGDRFRFSRASFDGRGYIPLGSRQRVLAVRLFTQLDYPDPGSEVPFYLMKTMGGNETLRGFRNFRFRDSNQLYMSAEYRWEAASGVELAFFYDTGKVFADHSNLNFDDLHESYGFGIRGKSWLRTVFRLDIGHGTEGTFLWFSFGPSF